jgi:hypothetical protein
VSVLPTQRLFVVRKFENYDIAQIPDLQVDTPNLKSILEHQAMNLSRWAQRLSSVRIMQSTDVPNAKQGRLCTPVLRVKN